ncbi:zeta-sarcoglycan [Leptopilina heterotoma]|uniref:zeta-sarcoglycan n=1 Tax=Leptopilina heterotoma TaxID=63436 RepID=UPI001CA898F2|nr:zeta-sarcoglycan [Leptopilina heterotoma]XP_043468421.1 zeta-sarcoglycan [Leptopilina heterotoma]
MHIMEREDDENAIEIIKEGGNDFKGTGESPQAEHKFRVGRGQLNWSDEPENSNSIPRQSGGRQTPGPSSRTLTYEEDSSPSCNGFRLGVYGWRKRCLYSLVVGLMIIVILNLALTLWLLKVMEFSFEGIGSLKVVPGGIELRGQAAILDALIASSVRSRRGRNLVLESWGNFTASARSEDGRVLARFTLNEDRVDCVTRGFRITDPRGGLLFSADRERVVVGAETLRVTGVGGAIFKGSVQTPLVSAESGHNLRLESATRSLKIDAPQRVVLESFGGEISVTCLLDMQLQSIEGAIRFESKSVFLKGLKTAVPIQSYTSREQQQQYSSRSSSHQSQRESTIYQLCACASGKLFLASPEGVCQADKAVC